MNKLRKVFLSMSALFLSAGLYAAGNPTETQTVQIVDKSGKPPFSRTFKQVEVNDIAQVEVADVTYAKVMTVDMSGKPPFRRVMQLVPVNDVAQVERVESVESKTDYAGRPPFKRHK